MKILREKQERQMGGEGEERSKERGRGVFEKRMNGYGRTLTSMLGSQ